MQELIKKYGVQMLLGFVFGIACISNQLAQPEHNLFHRLHLLAYDTKVRLNRAEDKSQGLSEPVVIVDIDEKSLAALGQWPWSRHIVADLLVSLFENYGVPVVGVDVVFAEPERDSLVSSWGELVQLAPALGDYQPPLSGDQRLAQVVANYPVVLGYYLSAKSGNLDSVGVMSGAVNIPVNEFTTLLPQAKRYTANVAPIQTENTPAGYFDNPLVDFDGVFRRAPIVRPYNDQLYPSLSFAMLLQLLGNPEIALEHIDDNPNLPLESIDAGGFELPIDQNFALNVPYRQTSRYFDYISAIDVLSGEVDPSRLLGKVVIFGSSAPGLFDLRSTPVQGVYPGAEIHATLLSGYLNQDFKQQPAMFKTVELVGSAIFVLVTTLFLPFLGSISVLVVLSLGVAALLGLDYMFWLDGILLPYVSLAVLFVMLGVFHLFYNYWRESRQKAQVSSLFSQYVPPDFVDEMLKHPDSISLEGKEEDLSVLFSDVRGFTTFSEQVEPAELTQVMNRLLGPQTREIHRFKGTIDKYMGDAVMAFWGAPLSDPDHADHAIEAAFAMQKALAETNEEFVEEGLPPLKLGIGINSGPMNVGNMGSTFRMSYTVLGDNVNLGSRVEGITKQYGVAFLITEATVERTKKPWLFKLVDRVRVKGKVEPVAIYEPLGLTEEFSDNDKALLSRWHEAVEHYRRGEFDLALTLMQIMQDNDSYAFLANEYSERIQAILEQGVDLAKWDGVFTHTTK
ncbi:MAG: CHASE2 domain-containing protein [Pontibacterium sp.]